MIIAPPPTSTHPDESRRGANRNDLDVRRRHRRLDNDGSWSYYHRSWSHYYWGRSHYHRGRGGDHHSRSRDAEADTEMNPCVYSSNSQSGQGQNCDSLFHIVW
jgi:hypothetical protein